MEQATSESIQNDEVVGTEKKSGIPRLILITITLLFIVGYSISIYWSVEPDPVNIERDMVRYTDADKSQTVVGYTLVNTLASVVEILLDKPGGFLGNDVFPPSVFMDNMPAFEYGALIQSRDLTRSLRKEFSRSQSQSVEQEDLKKAEPKMYIAHGSWALPSAEGEYKEGTVALRDYLKKLSAPDNSETQFYARADNLREWFGDVSNRLGSYSQRLSASVGQEGIDAGLVASVDDVQATKTPWLEVDDVFYEARGACWALAQFLRAVEVDFDDVLTKKNAKVSLKQIIRELEATQETVWSPMILNGGGFGFVANHSLVMASYISRANAGLIDLKDLLSQG